MIRKLTLLSSLFFVSMGAQAATFALEGHYRATGTFFKNPDVTDGPYFTATGAGDELSFIEHRFFLRPNVIIDDRFSVRSELGFLQMVSGAPNANNFPEGFGATMDGAARVGSGMYFYVRRLWMEWASDWGILRIGRQPKSWGLGVLYNAGLDPYDDFATNVDRVGFQALLGSLSLNLGYEKIKEGNVATDRDDGSVYELALSYASQEQALEVGLLYARNAIGDNAALARGSSHDLSIFAKKGLGSFNLGGEFVSINDETVGGTTGALVQADYTSDAFKIGTDFGFASATGRTQFVFNANYKPFLILFNQSLGRSHIAGVRQGELAKPGVGSAVSDGSGAGALLAKLHAEYAFSNGTFVLGGDIGFAQLARQGSSGSKFLGFETDLHLKQKWFDHFSTLYALGLLIPGNSFTPQVDPVWGFQIKAALQF